MAPDDSQQQLAQRVAQAEAVVSGTVTDTKALSTGKPPFLSTHDPEWWQATVSVESVEKGKPGMKTVDVVYANSSDVAWFKAPKLSKGDHAVFLLQSKDAYGKPTPGMAVVDPLDVRPIGDLDKVRALVKNGK